MVELVNGNKGVVVITKSRSSREDYCVNLFHQILSCVMEAKADFCHSISPEFFLLDSTKEADYLSEDNLFAMSDIEAALAEPEDNQVIVSITGKRQMECSRLLCLRSRTHWSSIFSIDLVCVIKHLIKFVDNLYELGLELKVPVHSLDVIFKDFPNSVEERRREVVRVWMSSSQEPPCWWHLTQALRSPLVKRKDLAENIEDNFGKFYWSVSFQYQLPFSFA